VFVYPSGGINIDVFHPKKIIKKETFVLGFVSNFIDSKGWKILLLAVENILKNNSIKNIELIIIGDGPDKQKINTFLEKINIKYKLISSVSQEELAKYYNEFNLFAFPTERESLGLVGLEAMACGTPVVAGKVDGPMGYINDGVNSFLFKRKDSYDLEKKIVNFYNLSTLEKEIMRTNAIKTAKYYDCRIVNKDLVSFLNEL
jgi:glycosyltransferase involved in cell wall biosynthesis